LDEKVLFSEIVASRRLPSANLNETEQNLPLNLIYTRFPLPMINVCIKNEKAVLFINRTSGRYSSYKLQPAMRGLFIRRMDRLPELAAYFDMPSAVAKV